MAKTYSSPPAMTIDPARRGALPSLRMTAGIVAGLPVLQEYPPAKVTVTGATGRVGGALRGA